MKTDKVCGLQLDHCSPCSREKDNKGYGVSDSLLILSRLVEEGVGGSDRERKEDVVPLDTAKRERTGHKIIYLTFCWIQPLYLSSCLAENEIALTMTTVEHTKYY